MITRHLFLKCGIFLFLLSPLASAQEQSKVGADAAKRMRVFGENEHQARTGIFSPNRDCIDAKIEVAVRNGEAIFSLKEIEMVPNAYRGRTGEGKIEYVLGTGDCRILISAAPAK